MTKTLLEKAHAHRVNYTARKGPSEEQVEELSIAWLRGQISFTQVAVATGTKGSSVYGLLAVALRRAVDAGRIKVSV